MPHALSVYHSDQCIFTHDGAWLHPLFALETFLQSSTFRPEALSVHDKIVGAGSAFLIAHLGISQLHAGILSQRGKDVLQRFNIHVTWETAVERISCATEGLLDPEMQLASAVAILRERALRTTK